MKYVVTFSVLFCLATSVYALNTNYASTRKAADKWLINIIEGTVYDPNHNPVPDLWVELQNEFGLNMMRIRTGASGRFTFPGIGPGHYYIKVYTSGTNFEEQSQSVEVVNIFQNSSDAVYQDIFLKYRKGIDRKSVV